MFYLYNCVFRYDKYYYCIYNINYIYINKIYTHKHKYRLYIERVKENIENDILVNVYLVNMF